MEFSIYTFPFEQIGWGLRQMSLSGTVGNMAAIVMYVLIGLVPCAMFLWLRKRGTCVKADWMLILVSVCLFVLLYYMINPGLILTTGALGGKEIMGCTFYSVLAGYLVLRILEKSKHADSVALQKGLRVLLYVVMLLFAYVVVSELAVALPASIKSMQEANTVTDEWLWGGVDLTATYVFLVLGSVADCIPYVLDILVLFAATRALNELLADAYSDAAVEAVRRIADVSSKALAIVVITSMVYNVAQVVFRNSLYQINVTAVIPVLSVVLLIVILIVARFIEGNQRLKRDNDMFI